MTVEDDVSDDITPRVMVNGDVVLEIGGKYNVTLKSGSNDIVITAIDESGKQG